MPNTVPDGRDASTDLSENTSGATPEAVAAEQANGAPAWSRLKVAVIDDAMHPPRLDKLAESEAAPLKILLIKDEEVLAELKTLGCAPDASADERLSTISQGDGPYVTQAKVTLVSPDTGRMIEEYRSFRRLTANLLSEVADVHQVDPFQPIPDLASYDLVLLDYFLEGPPEGGDRALQVASTIRQQPGRKADQQIVLMSSDERVRHLRGEFRAKTKLTGSSFAFVSKPDLDEGWKVKAHLGMLERARPYTPSFSAYRQELGEALQRAHENLLTLVDDLDMGDYAFLQHHALMKDGHPLGDYVFWLLSSQLLAYAFEQPTMRVRQRELDALEFVGAPFAATEPSVVVANFLHSALVSRDVGPLGPHPRAKKGEAYAAFPLVHLGDVFFDQNRTKAIVVMSAACDLAFSPTKEREPDGQTPVLLVPGKPVKLRDAPAKTKETPDTALAQTDGLLHKEEVYRIVWSLAKYRSVELAGLEKWLTKQGYVTANRDRLRSLFALKLQQEFGAHLLRVGPPVLPPTTTVATGQIVICSPAREATGDDIDLRLSRFKGIATLRVTPHVGSLLKKACEDLRVRLSEDASARTGKDERNALQKLESLDAQLSKDGYWIDLLNGVELNSTLGSVKPKGWISFVLGDQWPDQNKPCVVLQILEGAHPNAASETPSDAVPVIGSEVQTVSGAD